MMSILESITNFLSNLHLTLVQWLLVSLATAFGVLVVMFKLQGSKLHLAQVQLLTLDFKAQNMKDRGVVSRARTRYTKAMNSYIQSKGR